MSNRGDVTRLLIAHREGDREAFDRLLPLIYDDLRRIARARVRKGPPGHTLQTSALISEAYMRLVDQTRAEYQDRQHFLAVCARAMRNIVISNARRHAAAKRGGGQAPVTFDDAKAPDDDRSEWLLRLDRALETLTQKDPQLGRVVECRYFAGYTEEETAEALGTSLRTVQRNWQKARAWLRLELGE